MLHCKTTSIWLVYIVTGIWRQTFNTLAETCSSYGALRLVGGSTWREGRVEICLNSVWGTVCDDFWGSLDAQVTCRQLGYPVTGAMPLRSAHFGPGTGPIHIGSASCDGSEQRIVDCRLRYENGCKHSEDAGVSCPLPCSPHGGVRLTGSTPGRGTVEICLNGTWGTVCDNYWNISDAEVVCRQLAIGYDGNNAQAYTSAYLGEGYGPVLLDYVNCNGDEASLYNCEHANTTHRLNHSADAGVDCTVPNESGDLETTSISSQPMYISSMVTSSSLYIKSSSITLSLKLTSTVSNFTQTSSVSLISQSQTTSTANAGSTTQLHTFAVSSTASFNVLQSKSLEDIKPLSSSELLTVLTQTSSFQALHTSPASTIAAEPNSPLSLTATPTLTQTVSTGFLFTSPSSTSAAGWKQDNQPVAIGVSVAVVILCIAAVVVAMMIAFAVYMYRKKHQIFTMSIAEDPQLKDIYTRYEDTHTLIDDKQPRTQEEHVDNPSADDDNDDHEQIELIPMVVERESAGDLHALKTQTSSADLEPTKHTNSVFSSETHVYTHEDTTAMRAWDSDMEHDVKGEKIELIQKPQSATGNSPRAGAGAASVLSDGAHGGSQRQGDDQSGADHEEMKLRKIDDSFDQKSHQLSVF